MEFFVDAEIFHSNHEPMISYWLYPWGLMQLSWESSGWTVHTPPSTVPQKTPMEGCRILGLTQITLLYYKLNPHLPHDFEIGDASESVARLGV